MNINEINNNLQKFWNDQFHGYEAQAISKTDVTIDNKLDEYCKYIGDNCTNVMDYGNGFSTSLIIAKILGSKCQYCLGLDTSENAINFFNKTCELSHFDSIEYKIGDQEYLKQIKDESFDGIVCSNVLDVIPTETSEEIIKNFVRILKNNGLILLKFNFYLTPDLISKLNMIEIATDTYTMNGVLRGVNKSTEEWINKFKSYDNNIEVLKIDEFERVPNFAKDRIIVLRKSK